MPSGMLVGISSLKRSKRIISKLPYCLGHTCTWVRVDGAVVADGNIFHELGAPRLSWTSVCPFSHVKKQDSGNCCLDTNWMMCSAIRPSY